MCTVEGEYVVGDYVCARDGVRAWAIHREMSEISQRNNIEEKEKGGSHWHPGGVGIVSVLSGECTWYVRAARLVACANAAKRRVSWRKEKRGRTTVTHPNLGSSGDGRSGGGSYNCKKTWGKNSIGLVRSVIRTVNCRELK